MIQFVDVLLSEWAEQVFGGYPSCAGGSLLAPPSPRGFDGLSDESSIIDTIVCKMVSPWQTVVYVHYLGKNKSLDQKLESMSLVAEPSRKVFRGSDKAREERAVRYQMGKSKYFTLLHQSHEIIAREWKSKKD